LVTPREVLQKAEPLKDDTRCAYCRLPYHSVNGLGRKAFHAEHIIPESVAPELKYEISNLTWACLRCNLNKSNFTDCVDPISGVSVKLFHAKEQEWFLEFQGTPDGMIHGQTQCGRGTTSRIKFNTEIEVVRHRSIGFEEDWWP